jgi:hypothetical protein
MRRTKLGFFAALLHKSGRRPHARRMRRMVGTIPMIMSCRGLAPSWRPLLPPSALCHHRRLGRHRHSNSTVPAAAAAAGGGRGDTLGAAAKLGELSEAVAATATEPEMLHGLLPTQRQPHRRRRRGVVRRRRAETALLLCCRRQAAPAAAGEGVAAPRRSQNWALPALA